MIYFLIYKKGTVTVVACVRQCVADRRYRHDRRYTLKKLSPPVQ